MKGLCKCGCGQKTIISVRTDKLKGWIKDQPRNFVKGHSRIGATPWNKGKIGLYTATLETRKKMSDTMKGKVPSNIKMIAGWNRGKKLSEEHIKHLSEAKIGTHRSEETKQKISDYFRGEKHPNWKGGVTPINDRIRKTREYVLWRRSVFERDDYTCVWCGQRGRKLNADHIKPFSLFPELRFAIDNGRTLCVDCHHKTSTWGYNAKFYKE